MSNIVENLFSAVDIQIDSKLRQTDYARTIIGTVIGCIDPEQRIYKINYQDTEFEAQAPTGEYDKDEQVKILTTNIEDESLKVIVGRTSVSDLITLKESSLYTSLGSSIVEDNEEDDIVEYTLSDNSEIILYEKDGSNNLLKVNKTLLEKHLKESMIFSIGAEVLAELNSNPVDLVFKLSHKGQLVSSIVKIEITQNSFDFKSYQSYFKDYEFDTIESIYLKSINELSSSEVLKIKNITFNIVKENESANRMQAVIYGYEGDTLHDKVEQITIEARMMQGAVFIDPDLCSFQWSIEDPWEEGGWKKLEGARWQRPIVQLTSEDVYYSPMRYKAEITYGEMIFEASTFLKNLDPEYGSRSITINGNDADYSIQLIASQDKSELYKWEHVDVYRQQETVSQELSINTLSVNRDSNYNQYICHFKADNKYIGSASIVIDNSKLTGFYEEKFEFAFSDNEDHAPFGGPWAKRIGEISNIDKPILWKRVTKSNDDISTIMITSCKNKNVAHIRVSVDNRTHWLWKVYYSNGFIGNPKVMLQGGDELVTYYLCKKTAEGEIDYASKKVSTITSDVSAEYPYLISHCQASEDFEGEYAIIAKYGTADYQGISPLTFYWTGDNFPFGMVEDSEVVFGKTESFYIWAKETPEVNSTHKHMYKSECPYNNLGKLHYDESIGDWSEPTLIVRYAEDGAPGTPGIPGENGKDAVDFNLKSSTSYFKVDPRGVITPSTITFWAEGSNLPDGSSWKIQKTGTNIIQDGMTFADTYTYEITTEDLNKDSLTFTASLGDNSLTDAITIIKLNDGADGQSSFSTVLSNNTVTFNKEDSATEVVNLEVYYGAEKVPCYTSVPEASNLHPYVAIVQIRDFGTNAPSNEIKAGIVLSSPDNDYIQAEITNPKTSGRYYLQVTVQNGENPGAEMGYAWRQNIDIGCLVVDTGIRVSLYNENYVFESSLDETKYPLEVQVSIGMATAINKNSVEIIGDNEYCYDLSGVDWDYKEGYYWIINPVENTDYNIGINIYKGHEKITTIERKIAVKVLTPIYSLKSNKEYLEIDVDKKDYQPIEPVNGLELATFSAYIGNAKKDGWNYLIESDFRDVISESFQNNELTLYLQQWPFSELISKPITVKWINGDEVYDTKTFTLKSCIAQIDYEFELPGSIKVDRVGTFTKKFKILKNGEPISPGEYSAPMRGYYVFDSTESSEIPLEYEGNDFKLTYNINMDYSDLQLYYYDYNDLTSVTNKKLLATFTVNYVFEGSEYELTTYKAFNALTEDGQKGGLYYLAKDDEGSITGVDGNYTRVYPSKDNDDKYTTSSTGSGGKTYDAKDVALYVNAEMIKTGILNADLIKAGSLSIKKTIDGENYTLFSAGMEKNQEKVTIGGFNVIGDTLSSGENTQVSSTSGVIISPKLIQIGESGENSFTANNDCTGHIGPWQYNKEGFYLNTSFSVQKDSLTHTFVTTESKFFKLNTQIRQLKLELIINASVVQTKSLTLASEKQDTIQYTYNVGEEVYIKYGYSVASNDCVFSVNTLSYSNSSDKISLKLTIDGAEGSPIAYNYKLDNSGNAILGQLQLSYEPTVISDRRFKKEITDLKYIDNIFNFFEPCSYSYIYDENEKTRFGFIVQDVEKAFEQQGLDASKYGLIQTNEDGYKSLAYTEFIALNTHEIQKLKKRIIALEAQNADLEARIAVLEKIIINSN